jgi:hypothetical protein
MGASLAGLRGHDGDGRKARLAGALLHAGERCLDEVERDHEVDVHHPLDLLHVLLLDLLRHEHALVADEDVDGAGLLQRALDGARVPHVRREDADVLPRCGVDGSARVLEPRGVAGEDGDPCALARGGRGHSEPDAAGPARDEHVADREQDARARKASAARRPTGGASSSRRRRGDAAMATK